MHSHTPKTCRCPACMPNNQPRNSWRFNAAKHQKNTACILCNNSRVVETAVAARYTAIANGVISSDMCGVQRDIFGSAVGGMKRRG